MAGHVSLLSRGRPPSLATTPPKRLKHPRRAECTNQRQRGGHENDPALSSEAFPPRFPAFSPPFTPLTPRFPGVNRASSSRKTDPPRSVVHEYIRRGIYTSEKHAPAEPDATSRTSTLTREVKKDYTSPPALEKEKVPNSALPFVRTGGEKRQGVRWQQNGFDRKSPPRRMHTQPPGTEGRSGTSFTARAPASANAPKLDTANLSTIRSCILYNQQKLTELTAELTRIADPYAVKEFWAQKGQPAARHPHLCKEPSATFKKPTRSPSAPAGSRRHTDKYPQIANAHHGKTGEVAVSRVASVQRSQKMDPNADLQQDVRIAEDEKADSFFGPRSASTPASFAKVDGTFKSRPLKPAIVLPVTTSRNVAKSVHLSNRGKDLSRTLIRKEPLSAKEVRKLVFAWKSADQQLEDKMNFWVRELPTEVRAAAGVEKKFLALRDCVSSLWKASEERALAVLKMHQMVADCKESYQSGQGQLQSALIGVQGGLLAASTKIKQIDRLIRLQRDVDTNEEWADYCIISAAGYPFTPYTSVYTSSTRAHEVGDTNAENHRVTVLGTEPATNAETPEEERNRKDSCVSSGTNEAHVGLSAAVSSTPFSKTGGRNNNRDENVTREAAPAGAHMFVTRNCVGSKGVPRDAPIPISPGAAHLPEYGKSDITTTSQYAANATIAGLTSAAAPVTPAIALASESREKKWGTAEEKEATNSTPLPLRCGTDNCIPLSVYSAGMSRLPPDAARNMSLLRVKTVESPYACEVAESDEEKKFFHNFADTRTRKRVSPEWKATESKLAHLSACLGIEQKRRSENVVGPLVTLPSIASMELINSLPSSESIYVTRRRGKRSCSFSPRFRLSSNYSYVPPSAAARGSDLKEKLFEIHPHPKAASFFPDGSIPVALGKLDKQAKDANLRATEIHNEPEGSHAGLGDNHRDSATAVLHPVQKSWHKEDLSERRRMSGEISKRHDAFSLTAQHEGVGDHAMKDPPNNPYNEDVSWAADLVSRWRAQRR